jgi:hypothetical protein
VLRVLNANVRLTGSNRVLLNELASGFALELKVTTSLSSLSASLKEGIHLLIELVVSLELGPLLKTCESETLSSFAIIIKPTSFRSSLGTGMLADATHTHAAKNSTLSCMLRKVFLVRFVNPEFSITTDAWARPAHASCTTPCSVTRAHCSDSRVILLIHFIVRIVDICFCHLRINYPPPRVLEYAYPPPNEMILNNIKSTMAAVPRFYTQVW